MVRLTKIYTRTGDGGDTGLATGTRVRKTDPRVAAYGEVDEANACLGLARLQTGGDEAMDAMLARIQNELFDLGADLATPQKGVKGWEPLRITDAQVARLEADIDRLNQHLAPLDSFVLPAGTPLACALHLARTVTRRAERTAIALIDAGEQVTPAALRYLNRLSDLFFVAARWANSQAGGDVLWRPGATREDK